MHIILYIIIISLLVAAGFLGAFFWAVHDGQYEDGYTPSMRILIEEDMLPSTETSELPISTRQKKPNQDVKN